MALRAVTFDYGGTLDGEASHWLDRFVELYREAGMQIPFERLKEAFYGADEAAYADPGMAAAGLEELMDFHVGVQLEALGLTSPELRGSLVKRFVAQSQDALDQSREVLVRLAGRFRLGVISNFYGNVGRILADAHIAPLLSSIVDSNVVGMSKPDRGVFDLAVAELGVPAGETCHIGDSYERDVVAARDAGLRAVWLVGPGQGATVRPGCVAEVCVRTLDEFVAHLDAQEGSR